MALTPEFISAVSAKNLLRVRIMLKDSLLVDKSFYQFREMSTYVERCGVNFWKEKTEEIEKAPKSDWNMELMNLELTRLINDFTKERLKYCQSIIENVYGTNSCPNQPDIQQHVSDSARMTHQTSGIQQNNQRPVTRTVSSNNKDYRKILSGASVIKNILKDKESPSGGRSWIYRDIDTIHAAAKEICTACENIKSRRG